MLALALCTLPLALHAPQVSPEEEAVHEALRAVKAGIEEAFNRAGESALAEDFEAVLEYVHDDAVLTAMNGECVAGKDALRAYFQDKMVGDDRTLHAIHHEFEVDALSILHGDDTAISYGSSVGRYDLTEGIGFEVEVRWSCTLVEQDGRWLVASFQFGPSIFDNPLLDQAQRWLWVVGAVAGVAGLVVGFGVTKLLGRS